MNNVKAEPSITLDSLKNNLENSSIMEKYNTEITIENYGYNSSLYILTDDIFIRFLYEDGILSYVPDSKLFGYLFNKDQMSADDFLLGSQISTAIASEVVAYVVDLYGYTYYHGDWIGHMLPNDYDNQGIGFGLSNIDEVAFLQALDLNLNGPFEAMLYSQDSSNPNKDIDESTESNIVISGSGENIQNQIVGTKHIKFRTNC